MRKNFALFICLMAALVLSACADYFQPPAQNPDVTSYKSDGSGAGFAQKSGALTYKQDTDGAWTIPNACTPTGTSADEIAVGPYQRLMCDPDGYVRLYYADDPMVYPGAGQTGSVSFTNYDCLGDTDCTIKNPYPSKNLTSTCVHTQSSDPDGYGVGTCLFADQECFAAKGSPCQVKSWLQCENGTCKCPVSANLAAAVTEACNNVDDNCDGKTDEVNAIGCVNYWTDSDGDGFGSGPSQAQCLCGTSTGWVTNHDDCNDSDAAVYPNATETCNSVDDNCDSKTDEPFTNLGQGCGTGACANGKYVCSQDNLDTVCSTVSLAKPESCNGVDDDCNSKTDEGVLSTFYFDGDTDGFGSNLSEQACSAPIGFVANSSDCDDAKKSVNPNAIESCNGVDDNCNGQTDEDFANLAQSCGKGECAGGTYMCTADTTSTYCTTANKASSEVCDSKDNDCNGQTDESFADLGKSCGMGICSGGSFVCSADGTGTVCSTASNAVKDVCDNLDNDCNGATDEDYLNLGKSCGTGVCAGGSYVCTADTTGTVCSTASKAGSEVCNQLDDDCDGTTDVDANGKALCDLKCPTVKKYDCNKWYTVNLNDDFANSIDTYQCAGASKAWPVKQSAKELFIVPIAPTGSTYTVQVKNSPGVFLSMLNDCAPAANTTSVGPTQCVAAGIASSAGSAGVSKGVVGTTYAGIDAPANGSVTFQIVCPL